MTDHIENGVWLLEIPLKRIISRELPRRKGVFICLSPEGIGKSTRAHEVGSTQKTMFNEREELTTVKYAKIDGKVPDEQTLEDTIKRLLDIPESDTPLVEGLKKKMPHYSVLMLDQCEKFGNRLEDLESLVSDIAVGCYDSHFKVIMFFSEMIPAVKALTANGGNKVRPLISSRAMYSEHGIKWTKSQCTLIVMSIIHGILKGEVPPDEVVDSLLQSCCMSGTVNFCIEKTKNICQVYARVGYTNEEIDIFKELKKLRKEAILVETKWKKYSLFYDMSVRIRVNPPEEETIFKWCKDPPQ
jgi:hypothetical protein